ncbi:unnamed protein product [Zymoseptoria tritici ST99CH_3D1]|nr:unnamed protein product [Zymoseptoria tritici ST99CH_3D1]
MASSDLKVLLTALRDRELPPNKEDIARAFEDRNTQEEASSWVQEFLQPSTLLTKEELDFYEKHGIETTDLDPPAGRPLSDTELEAAIDSLEASTAAIERQTKILETQRLALKKLQSQNANQETISSVREKRQTKLARHRAQIDFDIDELSGAASGRLRSTLKQSENATSLLPSQTERSLERDDRLLAGLSKLLPRIADSSLEKDESADVEKLCSALTSLCIQEIHARMDRMHHETIAEQPHRQQGASEQGLSDQQIKQREAARSEIQELEREVEGLVAIVVDQQHRQPLKKGLLSAGADIQVQRAQWSEYTVTALLYLTSRLDAIVDHVQHLHSHNNALHAVSDALEETAAKRPAGTNKTTDSTNGDKANGKGLIPLRLVQANRSEPQDPAIHLLRQLDIRVPENSTMAKLMETLESALRERRKRLDQLGESTEHAVTESIAQSLAKSDVDLQHLLAAVYANSKYATTRLVDEDVQTDLDELESRTQVLGSQMRELDIDAIARAVNKRQAELVQTLNG